MPKFLQRNFEEFDFRGRFMEFCRQAHSILSWVCVITTTEAAFLGQYCNDTITCDYTGGLCHASNCGCDTGYGEYKRECKSIYINKTTMESDDKDKGNYSMEDSSDDLTVSTGPDVTGRVGGSVTITCTVTGPEVNTIKWKQYRNNSYLQDITIDGSKYTAGGTLSTPSLTINTLNTDDAGQYQCTASNPGGTYPSNNKATVNVLYGQFNEDCTATIPCDASSYFICNSCKCLCNTTYYHKDKVCYPRTRLTPYISVINSTTSQFSVFWSHPSVDYDLVISYKVSWRQNGGSTSEQTVDRGKNSIIVNSGLMSGQLYIFTVSAVVRLTDPEETITIQSQEEKVRLDPRPPGPILHSESSLAHDSLTLKWTPPSNTFVTKYEVMIDGESQTTVNNNPMLQFNKILTPGKYYVVRIVTISGSSSELTGDKRSTRYKETIRITPTSKIRIFAANNSYENKN
ncbi:uncharacterized protein LOC134258912 [Saccostrea cucullata]|uniref:uncharacterized protein LOC134258912 n=1 Tax=Saccostrea cuccullata TaxID=36930 RepID=UPI002ED57091